MTDRPILFSGQMVNAILEGRKTQTRRVINPQPESFKMDNGEDSLVYPVKVEGRDYTNISIGSSLTCGVLTGQKLRYVVGDRLYVREAHYLTDDGHNEYAIFAADEAAVLDHKGAIVANKHQFGLSDEWAKQQLKLRPSIHMPRWASRLTLVVTDVRVQRLQEISETDSMAEGLEAYSGIDPDCGGYLNYANQSEDGWWLGPKDSFRSLWNSINGPRGFGWDVNPWVVAVTFETHQCNIDKMEVAA